MAKETRTKIIRVRLTSGELRTIENAAKNAKRSLSDYVRLRVMGLLPRQERERGA